MKVKLAGVDPGLVRSLHEDESLEFVDSVVGVEVRDKGRLSLGLDCCNQRISLKDSFSSSSSDHSMSTLSDVKITITENEPIAITPEPQKTTLVF